MRGKFVHTGWCQQLEFTRFGIVFLLVGPADLLLWLVRNGENSVILMCYFVSLWKIIGRLKMTIPQAIGIGIAGNEASKKLTGTDNVSVGRSTVAVGAGAAMGAVAAGTITVGAAALGVAAAPIAIPLAIASGICAGIASLFD
jgi:hypothetical protein